MTQPQIQLDLDTIKDELGSKDLVILHLRFSLKKIENEVELLKQQLAEATSIDDEEAGDILDSE